MTLSKRVFIIVVYTTLTTLFNCSTEDAEPSDSFDRSSSRIYNAWGIGEKGGSIESPRSRVTFVRDAGEEHPRMLEMSCPPRIQKATSVKERAYYFFPPEGLSMLDVSDAASHETLVEKLDKAGRNSGGEASDELCRWMAEKVQSLILSRKGQYGDNDKETGPPFFELHSRFPMDTSAQATYTFFSRTVPEYVYGREIDLGEPYKFIFATVEGGRRYRVRNETYPLGYSVSLEFTVKDSELQLQKLVCPKVTLVKETEVVKRDKTYEFPHSIASFPSRWPAFPTLQHIKEVSVRLSADSPMSDVNFLDVKAATKWLLIGGIYDTVYKMEHGGLGDEQTSYLMHFTSAVELFARQLCFAFAGEPKGGGIFSGAIKSLKRMAQGSSRRDKSPK
ncbi:hypothetical protein FOZ62_011035 [Perkinsus olseni]|uniref:Lipoprotein n=1 Tax=Perkinsus olseni TaxID=32597 RepID=A0A7J6TP44_PEROL|nr:hypothetical protein FOZ62_011035 [Perkinsus olseni]